MLSLIEVPLVAVFLAKLLRQDDCSMEKCCSLIVKFKAFPSELQIKSLLLSANKRESLYSNLCLDVISLHSTDGWVGGKLPNSY